VLNTRQPISRREALENILKRLPSRMLYYGSSLGAIAIVAGLQLPPQLELVAAGIGANILSNIIDKIAEGEDVPDEELVRDIQEAIDKSAIAHLLTQQDFLQAYGRLIQRLDTQKEISQEILSTLREGFTKISTAEQVEELKRLILQHSQSSPLTYEDVIEAFRLVNTRLGHIRHTVADIHIERSEVKQILDWISSNEPKQRLALVSGKPGQGKSVILQQLVTVLQNDGQAVLGIKADDLAYISNRILSLDDVQKILQLPSSLQQCVQTAADGGSCIVLIDQIDTLALTLNPDEQSLRVIIGLIERLREIQNVKIVVSCRDFEHMSDPVLTGLRIDRVFSVGKLTESDINKVLQRLHGKELQSLPLALRKLLETPLYLDIYAQLVIENSGNSLENVKTLQDLYGRLWALRIEKVEKNAPSEFERRQAVFHLVEKMVQQRKLKLHVSSLDEYPAARQYLQRTGFIQEEGLNLSFLHQTLFSYCYARKFVSEAKLLSLEVFSSSQGFFERQLIVEVLQHLRATNSTLYHAEIEVLLFPPAGQRIRYHLTLLMIKWLSWQDDPTDQEYRFIKRLKKTRFDDFQRFLNAAGNNHNPKWFSRFEKDVPSWLGSRDSQLIKVVVSYLTNFIDTDTLFIVEQVKPYLDRDQDWNQHLSLMLFYLRNWRDVETAFELWLHLLKNAVVSLKTSNRVLGSMATSNPAMGCRLLKYHCELAFAGYKVLKAQQTDPHTAPFPEDILKEAIDSYEVEHFMAVAAQSTPQAILEHLLPCFIQIAVGLEEERRNHILHYPSSWFFAGLDERLNHNRDGISFAQGILAGLSFLAQTQPGAFREVVHQLSGLNTHLVQELLMKAFSANPCEYNMDIYYFLTSEHRIIHIQPEARYLLAKAYECSNQTDRNKWEDFIFSLSLPELRKPEESFADWRQRYRWRQHDQLDFLLSIDDMLLTKRAIRKKYEILRLPEFSNYKPYLPEQALEFGQVQAPVSVEKQAKLSDRDWLRIMRHYNEETDWDKPRKRRHLLEGGIVEMSRTMVEQVKSDPQKFYDLSHQFDEDIAIEYVTTTIQGIAHAGAKASSEWVFDLVRRYHTRILGYSRSGVASAVVALNTTSTPKDIISILITWAKDDPNPDSQEEAEKIQEILSETNVFSDGFVNQGINRVRGSVLQHVCEILFHQIPIDLELIYQIIMNGVEDECASTSTMAVRQLMHWHNESVEAERAIQLLEKAIKKHPILIVTRPVHDYLAWLSFNQPERAFPWQYPVSMDTQVVSEIGLQRLLD
jgi:Mrp family chromosome partitioning ATPase